MSITSQVLLLIVIILISGFLSMSEISLAASTKVRLQVLAEHGDKRARTVLQFKEHPGHFVTVVQIGINMCAIISGFIGEDLFSPYIAWPLKSLGLTPDTADTIGSCTSFILVTFALVVFSDLIPKRLSFAHPEKIILVCQAPMRLLLVVLSPFVWVLENASLVVIRLFGLNIERDDKITSEDIMASIVAGTEEGVIAPEEQAVIQNVFSLENRLVPAAMTARESVVYFTLDSTKETILKVVSESPLNHFLVCDKNLDHVIGYVESATLLRYLLEDKAISFTDKALLKPVQVIPDTLSLSEVLELFQRTRSDFAVVLNEYALVVGVITLSDVMSSVMGDLVAIPDEQQIVKRDATSWLVDGATPIVDMMAELNLQKMPESTSYETMAGFMMYMLRKIPKRTDKVDWGGYRFEVVNVEANRIDQILVTKL